MDRQLIKKAEKVYLSNFDSAVLFERAIFFSWGCSIGDCTFCYMSTQPKEKILKETKRSDASLLAEFILSKQLGWDIGFFTGGIGIFAPVELEELLKKIIVITEEKIWLSIGPIAKPLLIRYSPYIRGIVGSTETINPKLHKIICPSKPLAPYERMFEFADELGLKKAMTFIVGMGETRDDFLLLKTFIEKYKINKIHVYGLIPQKGTPFENVSRPTKEEQAWWIAQLRIAFPKLDIQCGIWEDRTDYLSLLLKAGANSISKFKATKLFGTDTAKRIEEESATAGRMFLGTLTEVPAVNWKKIVYDLPFEENLKKNILEKLEQYLTSMKKNIAARTRL